MRIRMTRQRLAERPILMECSIASLSACTIMESFRGINAAPVCITVEAPPAHIKDIVFDNDFGLSARRRSRKS